MIEQARKINIGDVVKVKGKLYLVFDIRDSRIFCRLFRFTKTGRSPIVIDLFCIGIQIIS